MEKKCKFSYNDIDDSFIISCRGDNENIKENFMFDDIIFSLSDKGKILGIQIRNITEMLEQSDIDSDILNNLKGIRMNIIQKQYSLSIGIDLISPKLEKKFSLGRIFMPHFTS